MIFTENVEANAANYVPSASHRPKKANTDEDLLEAAQFPSTVCVQMLYVYDG